MQLQAFLPALVVILSTAPQLATAASGFGASCGDGKIFKRNNLWILSAVCKRINGSLNYSEFSLENAIHDGNGSLKWEASNPIYDKNINKDCNELQWAPGAGNVIGAKCAQILLPAYKYSTIALNNRIGNNNGNLEY